MTANSAKRTAQSSKLKFCTLSFALCAIGCRLFAEPLAECQARFGAITGDVGLLPQGALEWIEPHEGLPIEPGDHIRTGEDGRAELVMSDNALWALEPEAEVVAEHMDVNTGRFNLLSGTLLGKVDSARAAGTVQKWEFTTPASVAGIRGTEFALEFSKKEGARLGVFEGSVDFQPAETAEGLSPPVDVSFGHEAVSKRGRPIQVLARFSRHIQSLAAELPSLRRRQKQIQDTWTPFTTTVRTEARKKFVAPPPKRSTIRARKTPVRRSRSSSQSSK